MMVRLMNLFVVLGKLGLLSPVGLYRFITAAGQSGVNLMMLLKIAARTYGQQIAIVDERERISFHQLLSQAECLSDVLRQTYGLTDGKKVGFFCKNHASLVKAIFAVAHTGADIYLLHAEMSPEQFNQLLGDHDLDLLVHDAELTSLIERSPYAKARVLSYHDHLPAINRLAHTCTANKRTRYRTSASKLILLTGGTTGKAKKIAHKPSLFTYLPPFLALLTRLQLVRYQSAYLATPIYHGYGIAILLLCIALGKKTIVTAGFDAATACELIRTHEVEVVTVVPLMIAKMLKHNVEDLQSLACIASGGAELNPKLVAEVSSKVGAIVYNLYGTSEGGLTTIATPQDLQYSAKTIGKKIKHVPLYVLDHRKRKLGAGEIGQFCLRQPWSLRAGKRLWIETGDVGYRDAHGYYFLCGRTDDLVVSAGKNVYPIELERILLGHPGVEDAAVIGMRDDLFGQRLKAIVQPVANAELTKAALLEWLRPRAARHQMPKEIVFVERIAYTHLGKQDKKQLS